MDTLHLCHFDRPHSPRNYQMFTPPYKHLNLYSITTINHPNTIILNSNLKTLILTLILTLKPY